MKRRNFLHQSTKAALGAALAPTIIPSRVWGKAGSTYHNSKINLGAIGVGQMGTSHLRTCLGHDDVRVLAICDVRKEHREAARQRVAETYGEDNCATYNDFRELLARDDIDAIFMACPDHWHVLIGMEAARRGKAMYYEKPMSYTVAEAQAMRATLDRYPVVFQFGTQQRSNERYRFAVELARNGYLGEVKRVVVGSAGYAAVPPQPIEPVPEGFDYEMWLGPAPYKPFTPLRCTRNWTLIRDYSLGCLSGAYGIHNVDTAQWVLDADDSGPVEVEGIFGKIPREGLFDTYQEFEVEHTYANGVKLIHLEHVRARSKFPQFAEADGANSMAMLVEGSEGWIFAARGELRTEPKSLMRTVVGPNEFKLPPSNNHWRNFLDAVKTGSPTICPVGPGVKAEIVCQQAEISLRLGKKLRWDNENERFIDNEEANRLLSSPMRAPWHI